MKINTSSKHFVFGRQRCTQNKHNTSETFGGTKNIFINNWLLKDLGGLALGLSKAVAFDRND